MKRVLSIQDISCVGKCSLTVALPVLSAAELETAILPTAVLSTHTAFQGFTFRDLTADIRPIAEHWKAEKIRFDGIYTGYLGSEEQIEAVKTLLSEFRHPGQLRFVDPAMGDNGKLYTGFTPDFARKMSSLCGAADIIVPNLTEAVFMLGEPYPDRPCGEEYVRSLLKRLCGFGCPCAILTGVSFEPGRCGAAAWDSSAQQFTTYFSEQLPGSFHGTGDVFASACFGALMNGQDLENAMKTAVEFTVDSIRRTLADPDHNWYGVNFESSLPLLLRLLNEKTQESGSGT